MQGMRYEEGSGTMAGAMLVMAVGIALAVAASVGNLMICQNRARSLADLIAVQARLPQTWLKRMASRWAPSSCGMKTCW